VTDGDPAVIATAQGRVRGVELDGLRSWRGIPYARPPTGPLRFRPPQPVAPWHGVRDAATFAPVAWQRQSVNPFTGAPAPMDRSEDCLYLNVTVPAALPSDPRGYPVLVWVHGGGYVQGTGSGEPVGDGVALARRGLAVVSVSYRLGALGFLHLADVAGSDLADAGMTGFLDQVAALRWVRANVAAFGGDPRRVTVYGISAGAKSVANLLASPLTAGLISRAISGSGGAEHVASPGQGARLRRRFLRELGLADDDVGVGHLLKAPPADLLAAQEAIATAAAATWVWRPVLGGSGLAVPPIDAIAGGAAARIPLLIGNNGNEGATYQLMDTSAAGEAPRVLADLFGRAVANSMLAEYAEARPDLDDTGIRLAILGDERYGIPTQRLALAQAAHAPVWRYRFDLCPPGVPAELAGGHGLDMLAVWAADTFENGGAAAAACVAMAGSLAQFARGDPPGQSGSAGPVDGLLPAWPQFSKDGGETMIIDEQSRVERRPRQAEFDIWRGRTWQSGTWWQFDGLEEWSNQDDRSG
jgi:para-nitrobenzyl esterase